MPPPAQADLGEHDENITTDRAGQLLGEAVSDAVSTLSKRVYAIASAHAERCGVLVADTKMEFGVGLATPREPGAEAAALVLGDEVLTPDCSRYWPADSYEAGRDQPSLDKQFVRDYLKQIGFDKATPIALPDEVVQATLGKYRRIFELLVGSQPVL